MKHIALLLLAGACLLPAADRPLFVFDNGTGRGRLSIEEQTELARRNGYAGIFISGAKQMPEWMEAHRKRGLKILGIYTGMDVSKPAATWEEGLPEAIRQLEGTGALITFFVNGKAANGDEIALPVIGKVADMAAAAGLKMAIYPHHGFHAPRIEDALRLVEKANRPNLGIVFNLCHWLRSGDEANLEMRLEQALPRTLMVSINGADHVGDWDRLIQPLDRGEFDVRTFLQALERHRYQGPIGLQCYAIKGDTEENLARSIKAWRAMTGSPAK
jgi:sugar phosphate isomerase/epimerase